MNLNTMMVQEEDGDSTEPDVISSDGTPTSCGDSTKTAVTSSANHSWATLPESEPSEPWFDVSTSLVFKNLPHDYKRAHLKDMSTSLVFKNLPNDYTRAHLKEMLDGAGFKCRYDFLYLPADLKTGANLAYCFVHCVTPDDAQSMMEFFDGFKRWGVPTNKVCRVEWNDTQKGSKGLVEKFRNHSVMHHTVPDEFKPVLFDEHGFPKSFPRPTRGIQPPWGRKR